MRHFIQIFILSLLIVLSAGNSSSAQIFDNTKGKAVKKLLDQNLIVCSYGKGAYNQRLTDAFNNYWKATPFKIYTRNIICPLCRRDLLFFFPLLLD
jgi:hypothetical protein